MTTLNAAFLFGDGSSGLGLVLLIFAALIVGLYLWGSSRKARAGKAEQLQNTYRTMTRALLDGIPDGELVDAVAANLLAKLDKRAPDAYKTIPLLSRGRCAVYSVWMTVHELAEGGLDEYLHTPSGRFLSLAADGLELVGAPECAAALREAGDASLEEGGLPALQARFSEAAAREKPLDGCCDYIRNNPEEFLDEAVPAPDPAG